MKPLFPGNDGKWKIWDLRKFGSINSYHYFGCAPSAVSVSQTGLVALNVGARVQVWKDVHLVSTGEDGSFATSDRNSAYSSHPVAQGRPQSPYLQHLLGGESVASVQFRPYEDFCIVGTSRGVQAIVVPGSCTANYDTHAADPYETKKVMDDCRMTDRLTTAGMKTVDDCRMTDRRVQTQSEQINGCRQMINIDN